MKKLFYLTALIAVSSLVSSPASADGWKHHRGHGPGHHHGHGWRQHRGHHHHYYPGPTVYYAYPQPQVNYYVPAPPPPVAYYPQPPAYGYGYPDRRNPAGLAGGVVGSVFGYELGRGDPLATGIGAAAGSLLGNGINGRY
ncbi:MAG: hypothetical protein ACU84H_14015 [Gammaproteobacteria bacterium]